MISINEVAGALKKYVDHYFEDSEYLIKLIFEYLCEQSGNIFDIEIPIDTKTLATTFCENYKRLKRRKHITIDEELTKKFYGEDMKSFYQMKIKLVNEIDKYY